MTTPDFDEEQLTAEIVEEDVYDDTPTDDELEEGEEQQTAENACMASDSSDNPSGGAVNDARMDGDAAEAEEERLEAEYAELEDASAQDTYAENVDEDELTDYEEEPEDEAGLAGKEA